MSEEDYLEIARIFPKSNEFAIGTFERNVTLYRQQMRALNLAYALNQQNQPDHNGPIGRVAVIGGGAFGVTVSAALAYVGIEARLFERHQVLLPLQKGCDTRWVNPRYYEWPASGSESRYAGLPLLNWEAGTASQVADQLEKEFNRHVSDTGRLTAFVGIQDLHVARETGADDKPESFLISCTHEGGREEWRCDAVVYAIGFGLEQMPGGRPPFYWRNDNLGQPDLTRQGGARVPYLVSGTGDGGLTDIARLTITNFHHERFFFELFSEASDELRRELNAVIAAHTSGAATKNDWLYRQFERLDSTTPEKGHFAQSRLELGGRLRTDTRVTLNGRPQAFRDALSLNKVSLSNALLAFLLHKLNAFDYRHGDLARQGKKWMIRSGGKDEPIGANTSVIVRHGTARDVVLGDVNIGAAKNALIQAASTPQTAERLFPPGWWSENRRPKDDAGDSPQQFRKEFAPPTTVTLGTAFVSTLSDVLAELLLQNDDSDDNPTPPYLRVCLHRVIKVGDEEFFQQITPYRGILMPHQEGGTARVFGINAGIVGLAIRSGQPIIYRKEPDLVEQMKAVTNFNALLAKPIEEHVDCMLACPFFIETGGSRPVAFVLFADTSNKWFFAPQQLKLVYAASKGFVENIEKSLAAGRLTSISTDYAGHEPDPAAVNEITDVLASAGLAFDDVFSSFEKDLTFLSLKSTELDDDRIAVARGA